jgi:glycosyltransferase involved in cell wall biosynthesis
MCKVSVIIPSFNHARFLDERFRSVLSQTYQDYEIIFLDDASTDDTLAVFAKYQNHPKVRCFLNATNGGSTFKQWNKGVRAARGRYVWFAESDDASDPTFLETLVTLLDRHPNVGLAYTNSVYIDERGREGTTLDLLFRHLHPTRWKSDYLNRGEDECRHYLIFHNTIPNASAAVFRKALYEQTGYADERMKRAGDWWVWAKLLFVSDVAYVAAPLNRYRQEHAQCTRVMKDYHVLLEEMLRVIRLIASQVGFPPGGEERLCDIYLHHYRWLADVLGDEGPPTDRRIFELAGDISPRLFFGMVSVKAEWWEAEKAKAKQVEEALRDQYSGALLEAQRYRHELEQVTGSLAYRLARRLSRTRHLFAPEATVRHWAFKKLVRAAQVWKAAGLRGLAGRVVKKLVLFQKRAA